VHTYNFLVARNGHGRIGAKSNRNEKGAEISRKIAE
jgi:hypothetical protein